MIIATFILLYDSTKGIKNNEIINEYLDTSFVELTEYSFDFNPFKKMETFHNIIIKKSEGKVIFGFKTEASGNELLMNLDDISTLTNDFGFICYYFYNDLDKLLINYSSCSNKRIAWYHQSLSGLTQQALIKLKDVEEYKMIYKIYKLFCNYELLLSNPDNYIECAFGLLDDKITIESPEDNYNDLLSSNNKNYNEFENKDNDLPF